MVEKSPLKSRVTLLAIFAIALAPMLLASYMYFNKVLVPAGRTNNGILILPPLELDRLGLSSIEDEAVTTDQLEGKWALLILHSGDCLESCRESLYKARQVNIALHKEASRVERYLVDFELHKERREGGRQLQGYPHLKRVFANRLELKAYLDQQLDADAAFEQSYILVVDPIGNVMMYHTPGQSGKNLLEDLKRLLKVSKIG